MIISLPEETWEDLLRSMQGLAGDFISPGTRKNFEAAYREAAETKDTLCPWCKLPLVECACEEPEPEPVRCVECGMPVFLCECDKRILEEEEA